MLSSVTRSVFKTEILNFMHTGVTYFDGDINKLSH